jgi:hypothetical protein
VAPETALSELSFTVPLTLWVLYGGTYMITSGLAAEVAVSA